MRTQRSPSGSLMRGGIVALVAFVVVLSVLGTVAVSHAAASPRDASAVAGGPDGSEGPACADGERDMNPADGECARDRQPGGDAEDEGGPSGDVVSGTPCTTSADACVDLAAKKAWLIDGDGEVVRGPVPIAIGGPGEDATPRGTFNVEWKNRDHKSREYNHAPMPFAVFFAPGGIAFHGGDLKSSSRGCVRLALADAEAFFEFLEIDDEVQVR